MLHACISNWSLQLTLAQGQLKDSNKKVKDLKSKLEKKDDEKTALKSELEAKIKQVHVAKVIHARNCLNHWSFGVFYGR